MFKISFKVHQKNDNKWFRAAQLKRVKMSMNRSMTFMFCVLLGHFTRCCANLFQDFPFSLASVCTLSLISKLNARSILKVKDCVAKSDAILVAINKRINTNSNEARWLANGKPHRCYYTCDHMIFMKWVISLNNMTVM